MVEQSQRPIIEEQTCSEVTELTESDTKNGISVGELSGYTVSNETYNSMPPTLLSPDAEQGTQHIKEEPLEDSLEDSRTTDSHDGGVGNCEMTEQGDSHDTNDSATERQISKQVWKTSR